MTRVQDLFLKLASDYKNILKAHLPFFIILILFSVAPFYKLLLSAEGIIAKADYSTFPATMDQLYRSIFQFSFTWDKMLYGGYPRPYHPTDIAFPLNLVILGLVFPLPIAGALFMVQWTLIAGLGMYYMTYKASSKRLAGLVSALSFMYAPYFGNLIDGGFKGHFMAYAVSPFVIGYFMHNLRIFDKRKAVITGILLALVMSFALAQTFIVLFTMFTLALLSPLSKRGSSRKNRNWHAFTLIETAKTFIIIIGTAIGIHAFWIIPHLYRIGQGSRIYPWTVPIEDITIFSDATIYTLLNHNMGEFQDIIWSYGLATLYDFLALGLAILSFSAIMLSRKDKKVVAFTLLAIIGAGLASGGKGPLKSLYEWLYLNLPLFNMFNRPSFFMGLVSLSFAFLLGMTVSSMTDKLSDIRVIFVSARRTKSFNLGKNIAKMVALVSILLILSQSWVMLTGNFAGRIKSFTFSEGYAEVESFLKEHGEGYRVLLLPPYDAGQWEWFPELGDNVRARYNAFNTPFRDWPILPIVTLGWGGTNAYVDLARFIVNEMYLNRNENVGKLLGILGVKYIVLSSDQEDISKWWGTYSHQDTNFLQLNVLPHLNGIKEVWQKGPIHVYENEYALPLFYASPTFAFAVGDFRTLSSLNAIETFSFEKLPIIFLNQENKRFTQKILQEPHLLIMQGERWKDLVFNSIDERLLINPAVYVAGENAYQNTWSASSRVNTFAFWFELFYPEAPHSELDPWVITKGRNATLDIPFQISSGGTYEIWAKVFFGSLTDLNSFIPSAASLTFTVDDKPQTDLSTSSARIGGFDWVKICSTSLEPGPHLLSITNERGFNLISTIAVVRPEDLDLATQKIHNAVAVTKGALMYIIEPERLIEDTTQGIFVQVEDFRDSPLNKGWFYSDPIRKHWVPGTRWMTSNTPGSSITVDIPVGTNGEYSLFVRGFVYRDKAILSYSIDNEAEVYVDWYANTTENEWHVYKIGDFYFEAGVHKLTIRNTGSGNPDSLAGKEGVLYTADQDYIYVVPKTPEGGMISFLLDPRATNGISVTSITDDFKTTLKFHALRPGSHVIAIRLSYDGPLQELPVLTEVNGRLRHRILVNSTDYQYYYIYPTEILAGENRIKISATNASGLRIDQVLVYTVETFTRLEEFLAFSEMGGQLKYRSINPSRYVLEPIGATNSTLFLVFQDSYDSLWKAWLGNNEIESIKVFGHSNSFMIFIESNQSVTVSYLPYLYQITGTLVSIFFIVGVVLITIVKLLSKEAHPKSNIRN